MTTTPTFTVVLRGYDRRTVDDLVERVQAALGSADLAQRQKTLQALSATAIALGSRGYDRRQVDAYLAGALADLGGER